jgi:hypothetical protein
VQRSPVCERVDAQVAAVSAEIRELGAHKRDRSSGTWTALNRDHPFNAFKASLGKRAISSTSEAYGAIPFSHNALTAARSSSHSSDKLEHSNVRFALNTPPRVDTV